MRKRYLLLIVVLLAAVFASQATAQGNLLDLVFEPFKGFDLAKAYEDYSQVIDFFLYLIIFIGIAKVTLGRLFSGRGGKAVTIGMGLVLALSLSIMEAQMNFNLKAFGPIAAFIFILLVGASLFLAIKHTGFGISGSASVAFVIMYISFSAVTPNVYNWLTSKMPLIRIVFIIALIMAVWQLISSIWPRGEKTLAKAAFSARKPIETAKSIFPTISSLYAEEKLIKARLERITKKEIKESSEIIDDLKEMKKLIEEYSESPYARSHIAKKLNDVRPKYHYAEKLLQKIKEIDCRIEQFDVSNYEKLASQYNKLDKKGKALLKKQIYEEREKIKCEEKIKSFEKIIEKYNEDFAYILLQVAANLNAGNTAEAKKRLDDVIKAEEFIQKEFKRMRQLEKIIIALTRYEIKITKKRKK